MAQFKTRARALDLLGRQQIAGIPTAINELIKNAHDAYADKFDIDFLRCNNLLVLRDDGLGMTKTEKENQVYTDLAMLLYDIAEGADSFIWNGHTTVSGNSRFTVMDTHALQETGDNIKRTQYFNILTYDWEQMSRDREERVLLICDEAYLMIDRSVPQSLVYLRNVMKRARKYEAALGIISHSLVDFLHESIKQYGQALLDIPCYKILMGTDGKNLKETADLYDLTEAEKELLLARKRGHALFMAGAKRLHIQFDIPEYKFNYMGKGGGR